MVVRCLAPTPLAIYKRNPRHAISTFGLFFLACKMGIRVTRLGSIFLEALMSSHIQIGIQEAFIK